jgi:predicted NACHT family NTPase
MSDFDFQPYRDFILLDGDKQRALYTPTDALLPLQVGMVNRGEQTDSSQESVVEQLPVLDGLQKYILGDGREHVILAGRPGSGKSTALQQLRLALATEGLVPVLVQLKGDRCTFKDPSTLTLISSLRDFVAKKTKDSVSTYYQILSRRIQEACEFYNYDIHCSPPVQTQSSEG